MGPVEYPWLSLGTHIGHTWAPTGTPRCCLMGAHREITFLNIRQFQKFQRQIIDIMVNFKYFLTNGTCWSLNGPTLGS